VRTIDELEKVIKIMEKNGLKRGENGLELYLMVEVPSNVILIDKFAEYVDGFSIGTNDLTQLALGVDRNSALVAPIYNELDETVKNLVAHAISAAREHHKKIGICGQAPSDYPEFAKFLVECGIDSMSLNPDTVIKTTLAVLKMEKRKK